MAVNINPGSKKVALGTSADEGESKYCLHFTDVGWRHLIKTSFTVTPAAALAGAPSGSCKVVPLR